MSREAPASVTAIRNPNSLLASMPAKPVLSEAALFSVILTIRETGRRLAMSDWAVATACTLFHRAHRVMTTGDEQPTAPLSNGGSGGGLDNTISAEAIEQSFRHSLGDIDPYVSAAV